MLTPASDGDRVNLVLDDGTVTYFTVLEKPEGQTLGSYARIDGLLLTPPMCDMPELVKALHKKGIPFVSIAPGEREYASAAWAAVCSWRTSPSMATTPRSKQ